MAEVLVRDVEEDTLARLRARAAAHGRTLEAEVLEILRAAARPPREEVLAELDRIRAMTPPRPPGFPTAEELIRDDRDSR